MGAQRQGLHHSHSTLLLLWLAVTFVVLPSKIYADPSCSTSQEDGDYGRSCSSTGNQLFGGLDILAAKQADVFKSMKRPDVPLEAWESVSGLSTLDYWHIECLK